MQNWRELLLCRNFSTVMLLGMISRFSALCLLFMLTLLPVTGLAQGNSILDQADALIHPQSAEEKEAAAKEEAEAESTAEAEKTPGTPPESVAAVTQARAAFRELHRFPPESDNLDPAQARKVRLIYEIDTTLSEQEDTLRQVQQLTAQIKDVIVPEKWESVASIPDLTADPGTLKTLDSLYAVRNGLQQTSTLARQETLRADQNLNLAEKSFNRTEAQRIDFAEQEQKDPQSVRNAPETSMVSDRQTAELASQAAKEKLALRHLQSRLAQNQLKLADEKLIRFQPFLEDYRNHVVIVPENIEKQTSSFKTKEQELEQSLLYSQKQLDALGVELSAAASNTTAPASPQMTLAQLVRTYERKAAHGQVSLNQTWINHLNIQRQFYGHRIAFYQDELNRRQIAEIAEDLDLEIQRMESDLAYVRNRIQQAQQDADRLSDQYSEPTAELSQQMIQRLNTASFGLVESLQQEIWSTESILSRVRNIYGEFTSQTSGYSWGKLQNQTVDFIDKAWTEQLFIMNDKAFRVSTLFWIIVWVCVGYISALYTSRAAGSVLTRKTGMASGQSDAYQKLIFYLLIVLICIFIFNAFNFNMTSFTVISGILALAIGFGSQEVIQNFISGLILLVERPIHKGDIIEMDGRILEVETIGLRSTRVKDLDHSQKIMPNHLLLSSVITNWTLSDDLLRSTLPVGVAYGSPTRKTSELLVEAARSTEGVMESPEPFARFVDFGDNSLGFNVYFWTSTKDRLRVCSEVRHRIVETLEQEGIVIAFPQRDIHFDSERPLRVELSEASRQQAKKSWPPED
jgi:small-conductance mechanosensitive channel